MTPEQLRAIMHYLQGAVTVDAAAPDGAAVVSFPMPDVDAMVQAGLDESGSRAVLAAEWFAEMVDEVVTTPEFCDPGDPPELVLRYARDVVAEYIRKRFVP